MNIKSTLLGAAAALTLAANAHAAPNGWYAGLEGGATLLNDNKGREAITNGAATIIEHPNISFDNGWAVLATVGFEWGQWRFEGEAGYRHNDINRIQLTSAIAGGWDDVSQLTLMANMLYDIPLGDRFSLSLGAGVGVDRVEFKWPGIGLSDDDWRLAWQGIAGLNYAISPNVELFVDYRYLNTDGPHFSTTFGPWIYHPTFEDMETQTASAGLRWHFN
jgi:OOP family OmpA-OmpF porin